MFKKRIKSKYKYYNKRISLRTASEGKLYALMRHKNKYSEIVFTSEDITVRTWKLGENV